MWCTVNTLRHLTYCQLIVNNNFVIFSINDCFLSPCQARSQGGAGLAQPPHSGTFRLYYLGRIARQNWLSPPTKKMLAPHHSGIFGLYYPPPPPPHLPPLPFLCSS